MTIACSEEDDGCSSSDAVNETSNITPDVHAGVTLLREAVHAWLVETSGEGDGNGDLLRTASRVALRVLSASIAGSQSLLPEGLDLPDDADDVAGFVAGASSWLRSIGIIEADDHAPELPAPVPDEVVESIQSVVALVTAADLPANVLGAVHERMVADSDPERRRANGVFYTPEELAGYVASETLGRTLDEARARFVGGPSGEGGACAWIAYRDSLARLQVLDPACGCGALLLPALDLLVVEHERVEEALADLGVEVEPGDPLRSLHGIDIDPVAVEASRMALWLRAASSGRPVGPLGDTIRVGDALVDEERSEWRSSFDVVIGNPPFRRGDQLAGRRDSLRGYRVSSTHADLYCYFVERGLRLLRPGGRMGYVVPRKWLRTSASGELRKMLSEEAMIGRVVDLRSGDWFGDADALPSVLIAQTPGAGVNPHLEEHSVVVGTVRSSPAGDLADLVDGNSFSVPQTIFTRPQRWSLDPPEVLTVLEKIRGAGTALETVVGAAPVPGTKTGSNGTFVIDSGTRLSLISADPASADVIRPLLRGRDIGRWTTSPPTEWLICAPATGEELHRYPAVLNHLKRIGGRVPGGMWASRTPDWSRITAPKIIFPDVSWSATFAIDTSGAVPLNSAHWIPTDDAWLTTVLNSGTLRSLLWREAAHGKSGALRLTTGVMRSLPIPEVPTGCEAEVGEHVEVLYGASRTVQSRVAEVHAWLRNDYGLASVGLALREPHQMTVEPFVDAVRARLPSGATRLSDAEEDALRGGHRDLVETLRDSLAAIGASETRLSEIVIDAFGLTVEEVDVLRRSAPPRMPPGWNPSLTATNLEHDLRWKLTTNVPTGSEAPSIELPVGEVRHILLADVDEDETYRFRAHLRTTVLERKIEAEGQLVPVIVRRNPKKRTFQLVSGFRRVTALRRLGQGTVYAEIRDLDDDAAFLLAIGENTGRSGYSDLDRAHVVRTQRANEMSESEIGLLLGISTRRVRHLRKLLDLPEVVQRAVDAPEHRLGLDTALLLGRFANRDPEFNWGRWVARVQSEDMSFGKLKRALAEGYPDEPTPKARAASVSMNLDAIQALFSDERNVRAMVTAVRMMSAEERVQRTHSLRQVGLIVSRLLNELDSN